MTEPPPLPVGEILRDARDRLIRQLDLASQDLDNTGDEQVALAALTVVCDTARAIDQLTRAIATAAPPPPSAPFDVDRLCADVWNAVQEAGAHTAASDAAVTTIRKAAG